RAARAQATGAAQAGVLAGGGPRPRRVWSRPWGRFYLFSRPERGQTRAHLGGEIGVRHGAVAEKRAVVLDRGRGIAALVGDDREVVVRAGAAWIDGQRAVQQVQRVGHEAERALDEREGRQRLDVARVAGA